MIKIHHLGVDFGSSKTSVVGFSRDRKDEKFVLFYKQSNAFPTNAAVKKCDGTFTEEYIFFQEAVDKVWKQNSTDTNETWYPFDNLKESIVESNAFAENIGHIIKDCAEQFFWAIHDAMSQSYYTDIGSGEQEAYDFSELESIVFGYPEYYTPNASADYKKIFTEILRRVFDNGNSLRIKGVPEPELAAYAYHYAHRADTNYRNVMRDGEKILILDFGGHTLDIMVMMIQNTDGRVRLQGYTRPGSDSLFVLLGKDITKKICNQIYSFDDQQHDSPKKNLLDPSVEAAKCALLSTGCPVHNATRTLGQKYPMRTTHNNYKYFQLCYRTERGKSADDNADTVVVGVYDSEVDLQGSFKKAYSQIEEYLSQNEIDTEDIKHVFFTGGGSKIFDLRNHIVDKLLNGRCRDAIHVYGYFDDNVKGSNGTLIDFKDGTPITLSFQNAVALGAALVSSGKQIPGTSRQTASDEGSKKLHAQIILQKLNSYLNDILLNEDQKKKLRDFYEKHVK